MSGRPLSRHNSSVSISSAVRASPTPSGSTSPVLASAEGLSRRLSWNRGRDEVLSGRDGGYGHLPSLGGQAHSLAPPSRAELTLPEEHDLGSGWAPDFSHDKPWAHNYPSEVSLGNGSEFESPPAEENDDYERLNGTTHQRTPSWRAYQPPGSAGPSRIADAVARSPTLRNMGRRIRNASIRVVNIMGTDGNQHRMVRLSDEDEDGEGKEEFEMDRKSPPTPSEDIIQPSRPAPMPPENGLRGRTLCLFTPRSRIRRAMGKIMMNPWTETCILVLIMANVIILTIQAAPQLNTPRQDDGYFQSWEDYALLGLFIVFTVEMFARIITTGLIFDPETNMYDFLFGPQGLQKLLNPARDSLHRNTSFAAPRKAGWRSASGRAEPQRKATVIPEAPFQTAVEKSTNLAAQNRPYLRHSWHRLDMLAIIAFWITFALALSDVEATDNLHLYIFRALSVLRAGRLLVVTSGTATILHSLKIAGPLLITVGYFVIFAGALFSIIGVQSFRGSFRRNCMYADPLNSSNIINMNQQCGGYLDPDTFEHLPYLQLNGQPSLGKPKGYICPLGQTCETLGENPEDNTQSFDDIFEAAIQIVIIGSINTWTPVMYAMMDSDFYVSCLFFIFGVIVINFWLLNLVVAVVVETFQNIRAETKKSAFGGDDTMLSADPQWATKDKRHKPGIVLRLYEKTYYFWVMVILADLVAQATRTAASSETKLNILYILELCFTLVLDLEIAIRIAGYFPDWRSFLSSPKNIFDLFLAIITSIIQIPAIQTSTIYPWFTIFQLLRWYRVILAVPRMRGLLLKLFAGLTGLVNMVIFLLMINFLAAMLAVQLIRGDMPASATMNFGQIYNSFLGMYQLFSSENWTTVLFGAMSAEIPFIQAWLVAIFLCGWFLFSFFVVLQMFVAVIMENFAIAEEQKRKQQVEAFLRKADPPAGHVNWIDRLNPYRLMSAHHHAVKVHSLPPSLVLPMKQNVGQDVGGYTSYPDPRNEDEAKGAMRRLLGFEQDDIALAAVRKRFRPKSMVSPKIGHYPEEHGEDDDRGLTDLLPPLNAGPSADEHLDAMRERRNQQADFISAHPSFDHSLWIFKQSNPLRRFCQACFDPAYGDRIFGRPAHPPRRLFMKGFMFLVIAASITVAAVATPLYRKNYYAVHGEIRATWFVVAEVGLGAIFLLETVMKIIADGFIFCPNAYLLSIWNAMDFVILITILTNTTTSLIYIGGLSRFTRSLKAFRAIRLITLFNRLRDTLHAVLFAGATLILDAAMFMILYLIPFAVWGINIFAGRLYSCNNAEAVGKGDCIGEYVNSPIDDSLAYLTPSVWSNPGLIDSTTVWSFDDFRSALLILFEIVTLEGWIDVMTAGMNIVGTDLNSSTNSQQWNSIYYVTFNMLGAVIIFTLFTSVIIQNFSRRSGMAMFTVEQRNWVDLSKFIKSQSPSQLPKSRPTFGLRLWCYERATQKHGYWAWIFTFIYYIHILLLMFEDFGNNILTDNQLDWIFLFLSLIYALDLLIRFYGLGVRSFLSNGWNWFDLVVITGSFATTIPALRASSLGLPGNEVLVQAQKLFLTAMALKLVQRLSALNQLFKTAIASLPAIGNLFLLWAILFIFFAIMQMEVFGLTKMGNNYGARYQNFYTFGNALVMLSFMSTGEGWNGYMHDYTVAPPRCTDSSNFLFSDCGSPSWAFGLFISWNIISMYIFLNMFTGVVVESFAYVYQMPGGASLNREDIRSFKRLWAEFDTERTGYIKRKDLVAFFSNGTDLRKLSGVFEVRPYPPEYSMQNLVRASVPDPVQNASGKLVVASGVNQAVDVRRIGSLLRQLDPVKVRKRRQNYERLFHEARISDEHGLGISFTSMLLMLAHYNLIDDEKALQLDDLLVRRQKTERVMDLVNLDRVRGLLRTIYWRKRFLKSREDRKRTLNAEAEGIPAIVLEPMPASPPIDEDAYDYSHSRDYSPASSRGSSPAHSPISGPEHSYFADVGLGIRDAHARDFGLSTHSPTSRPLARQVSNSSMLSSEDAQYRRDSPIDNLPPAVFEETPETAMWGDMMREAVDDENDDNR